MKELQSATVSIVVWAVALVLTEMRSSLLSVKMKIGRASCRERVS